MNRLLAISIRAQLVLLATLVAVPAAVLVVLSGLRLREEGIESARRQTQQLAEGVVAEHRSLLAGAEQVVTVLAQLPEVRARDPRVESVLRALLALNPAYSNVFIADRQGTVWASGVSAVGFNVADRRYFVNAVRSGQLASGEYVVSRATAKPALNLGYPLRDERGEVVGVVCVGISLESFRRRLAEADLPRGANLVLLDHRGVILSRAVDEARYVGTAYPAESFRTMVAGPEALTFEGKGLEHDRRVISYRKLRLPGEAEPFMYVRVGIPVATALAGPNRALVRDLALFLSFLLLAIGLAVQVGKRSIADRIAALEDASRRVASGDLTVRTSEVVRGGELGRLGETFDGMAEKLASRERALVETQAQLLHAQKIESVGRLAGGVAHDFNNMLTIILGEAELIREASPAGSACRESAGEISRAALRSREVTRQLLTFSRRQVVVPRAVDLNALAAGVRPTLARLLGEEVELVLSLAPGLWPVRIDPAQVDQILVNLAVNARDAMPVGGRITVETANVAVSEGDAAAASGIAPGAYARLTMRDEGTGMDHATLSHIFEPFFTTKREGKGTGLGLATVYGIVTQAGGFVRVESAPGLGSAFRVYLPRTDAMPAADPEAGAAAAPGGSGRILLVEDEDLVRATARRMLEGLGYDVTSVPSPAEALALCARPEVAVDLLLTDVVMPEMKGTELRTRLEAMRPGLRTVFMSGYASDSVDAAGGGAGFVQKPFSADELAREIRRALA